MKVKTFTASTENVLDEKVNNFISNPLIEVLDIKYSANNYLSTMIVYRDKDNNEI